MISASTLLSSYKSYLLFIAIVSISLKFKFILSIKSYILLSIIRITLSLYLFKSINESLVLNPILFNSKTILEVLWYSFKILLILLILSIPNLGISNSFSLLFKITSIVSSPKDPTIFLAVFSPIGNRSLDKKSTNSSFFSGNTISKLSTWNW